MIPEYRIRAGLNGFKVAGPKLLEAAKRSHSRALTKFESLNKVCLNCNENIAYEKRRNDFCSQSCGAIYYNKRRQKPKKTCACGKVIQNKSSCCRACATIIDITLAKTDNTRRLILIRKHGHRCWECDNSIWNNLPIPLELDHIDGDSDNNEETNLRILCPNCHAQTPTYKAKNRTKGSSRKLYRAMRRRQAQL